MKIAFLTPFPPYRGGIPNYSEALYKELLVDNEIRVFNFKRLYPSIFFPGKDQYDNHCSNYLNEKNIIRLIDSINPFSWKKTSKEILKYNPEKVILRFWHPFFIPCYYMIIKKIIKKIPVYVIFDNIIPHENYFFQTFFIKFFLKKITGAIVMSKNVEKGILQLNKDIVIKRLFLPIITNNQVQKDKQIIDKKNKVIFLFFGLIRDYKGLDILLSSINLINDKYINNFELFIVGESYENISKYKNIVNKKYEKNIKWHNEYVSNDEINFYFSSADYIVLPYKTVSQSAIIPMAYDYNKPIIISNLEGLSEFVIPDKTGYIFESCNEIQLAKIIEKAIQNNDISSMASNINDIKNRYSIKEYSERLIKFIR